MVSRFRWWPIVLGGVLGGGAITAAWEFLLEDFVFDALGLTDRTEGFHEKIAYTAIGLVASGLISVGVVWRIWLRIENRAQLRQSEDRFRRAFQLSPGLFAISRLRDGVHYDVNEQWLKVLGYDRGEVIGRTAVEIGIWADLSARARLVAALETSSSIRDFEGALRAKDGTVLPVLISAEKVVMDGEERLLIVAQDITARKRTEDALRESERQMRGILDNMQDIYYRTDREGRFVKVSPAIKDMLGYAPEEALGRAVAEFYWNPDDEQAYRAAMKDNGGRVREHEMNFRHRDGHPVWLWTNGQYLHDVSGRVVGIEGTSRDITDRKMAEMELRRAHDELEARVRERTLELEAALEKVNEVSRAKSEFLAKMSHELRTPMNAILGFSDIIAKEILGPTGSPRYRDYGPTSTIRGGICCL